MIQKEQFHIIRQVKCFSKYINESIHLVWWQLYCQECCYKAGKCHHIVWSI